MAGRPRTFDEEAALAAAREVFWEKGYEAVGVRELLDVMGVCRQSFYDTFGDKRRLFLRAIERYTRDAAQTMRTRLEAAESPSAGLRELLEEKAAGSTGAECRGCLALNAMVEWGERDPEVADLLRAYLGRAEQTIAEAIGRAQTQGEIDPGRDPRALAQFLLFACLGYSAMGRIRLPAAMAEGVLETVWGVLAPAAEGA